MALPFIAGPKRGIAIAELVNLGAAGPRFTTDPQNNPEQPAYLQDLSAAGLMGLCTWDRDSFPSVPWDDVLNDPASVPWEALVDAQVEEYAAWPAQPHIWNIWNEWAGTGGAEESPMHAQVINGIARITRERMGPRQLLAHGSVVDGQPASFAMLDWTHVNLADGHFYTTTPPHGQGELEWPWDDALGGPLDLAPFYAVLPWWVRMMSSEVGLSSWPNEEDMNSETDGFLIRQADYCRRMIGYMVSLGNLYAATWFSYHNHRGFGVIDNDGVQKLSYPAYQIAARKPWPIDEVVDPNEPDDPDQPEQPDPDTGVHTVFDIPEPQLKHLWQLIVPPNADGTDPIPFDIREAPEGLGICRMWAENPFLYGAPLEPEAPHPDGVIQLFAYKAIVWGANGPRVIG